MLETKYHTAIDTRKNAGKKRINVWDRRAGTKRLGSENASLTRVAVRSRSALNGGCERRFR